MNDFLQSLRNGQAEKQRTPKTRKNYDNSYHYTSGPRYHSYSNGYQNTRSQQMKRPQPAPAGNQLPADDGSTTAMLAEAIETLSAHIETLAKNQDFLINAQERTADMMERQAIAIERIVNHLDISPNAPESLEPEEAEQQNFKHHYVARKEEESQAVEAAPQPAEPVKPVIRRRKKVVSARPAQKSPVGTKLLSREEVMDIIQTMRAEGATFDMVASRLIELGQPTFSGRGEWHAQTIHRLCNKK